MKIFNHLILGISIFINVGCTEKPKTSNTSSSTSEPTRQINDLPCLVDKGYSFTKTLPRSDDSLFLFGVEITLPRIASEAQSARKLNSKIEDDFRQTITDKTGEPQLDSNYFFKIGYKVYSEDTVLSLVITAQEAWHLSEGLVRIAVYHYDCKNDKILTTKNMLYSWGMSMIPLIAAIVEKAHAAGEPDVPDFDEEWIRNINTDIDKLKIFKNSKDQFVVIYPLRENPTFDGECVVSD